MRCGDGLVRYGETVVIRDGIRLDGISVNICQSMACSDLALIDRKGL